MSWWLAIRPKTLWAAFVPVVVGTAIALGEGSVHWVSAALAGVGALGIQIGTNLVNDYADFHRGADTVDRKGPTRVTQSGLLTPRTVLAGTVVAFGIALAAGIYLIVRGGWPILLVGLLSIISGILYTAGPKPLGYIGLGDLFVLLFFGPVAVAGTHYVQALSLSWTAVGAGLGPGLLSVALLSVNNLRDVDEDLKVGKRTLAVRFGERFARWEYVASVIAAALVPVGLFAWTGNHPWSMLAGLMLVLAFPVFRKVLGGVDGAALNPLLGFTGRLSIVYSLVFSLTWLI
jgi:1,4-dihydroxy-2-naphthoate octaprenyltransferase